MEIHRLPHHPGGGGQYVNVNATVVQGGGSRDRDRDRLSQWSTAETREFLAIRWELDQSFMETKRNRLLWETIASRMREKGYHRTPDQCKCKWKNLVTRYKGSETMEGETIRQFPFQEDMMRIFSGRMERLLRFDHAAGKQPPVQLQVWSEEEDEEDEEEEDAAANETAAPDEVTRERKKKRNTKVVASSRNKGDFKEVEEALREFMRWQMQMEARWLEASEAREMERRAKVMEWQRTMVALEEERLMMDRQWREREDERRAREEARAERRHTLIIALLTKLEHKAAGL